MSWIHSALNAAVLAGNRVGRSVFADARLPRALDRHLRWNRQADEQSAKAAERSHQRPERGKDAGTDW